MCVCVVGYVGTCVGVCVCVCVCRAGYVGTCVGVGGYQWRGLGC